MSRETNTKTNKTADKKDNKQKQSKVSYGAGKPRSTSNYGAYVNAARENDWTWYAANEQLLKDAASIQFSNSLGMDDVNGMTNAIAPNLKNTIPGVMAIKMLPTVGHSEDPSSAVNIAAKNINSWIRHANSGSRNYESSDIMMALLATSSVYTFIALLERLYGIARVYSQQNRYMAKTLLAAQTSETVADSIMENLADFRYQINQAIIKASTLKLPKGLSIVDRHMWLNTHIWADDTSAKAQIYVPVIDQFYKYVPTKFTTGGSLEYDTFSTSGAYQALFATLNNMIDVLIRDDDINTIWGDIIKAYGDEGCYKLVSLPEDYVVVPEYSIEVLQQISNSMKLNGFTPISNMDAVVQYNNYLISFPEAYFTDPSFVGSIASGLKNIYLDIPHDNPSVADNMVATRLQYFADPNVLVNTGLTVSEIGTLAAYTGYALTYGTELVYDYVIYRVPVELQENILNTLPVSTFTDMTSVAIGVLAFTTVLLSKFKHFPRVVIVAFVSPNYEYIGILGELDNYTTITYNNLVKLNNTALLNEFAVPQLGVVRK